MAIRQEYMNLVNRINGDWYSLKPTTDIKFNQPIDCAPIGSLFPSVVIGLFEGDPIVQFTENGETSRYTTPFDSFLIDTKIDIVEALEGDDFETMEWDENDFDF